MKEVLQTLLGSLRKSQRTTMSLVVKAWASFRQAASIPVATALAQVTGCQVFNALIRFYRLRHNPRIDVWQESFFELLVLLLREAGVSACILAGFGLGGLAGPLLRRSPAVKID